MDRRDFLSAGFTALVGLAGPRTGLAYGQSSVQATVRPAIYTLSLDGQEKKAVVKSRPYGSGIEERVQYLVWILPRELDDKSILAGDAYLREYESQYILASQKGDLAKLASATMLPRKGEMRVLEGKELDQVMSLYEQVRMKTGK